MPVYFDPSPNKFTQLSNVIGNYLNQRQESNQANDLIEQKKQAANDQAAQKRQELALKIQDIYIHGTPEQRARVLQLFPEQNLPTGGAFAPSQGEQNQAMIDKDVGTTYPTLPQSTRQEVAFHKATGTLPPEQTVGLLQRQDVTANKPSWTPEVQDQQAITDKRKMDAQQQATSDLANTKLTTIEQPESKQKIATGKATEASAYATAGKTRESTRGEKQANDMLAGMTGATQATPTSTATPPPTTSVSPIAQSIADRKYDPKLLRNLIGKNPAMAQALELQVRQIDPGFSMADYESYVATKKAYASGPQAQNITAINTAMRHLNSLYDASQKMDNSRFPLKNVVGNYLAKQTGNEAVQENWAAVSKYAQLVATELDRVVRGSSQLSEKETKALLENLGPNSTPAEIRGAVSGAVNLIAGRHAELVEGYNRGVGRPADRDWLGQGARNIIKKFAKAGIQGTNDLMGDAGTQPTGVNSGGLYGTYVPGQGLVKH